MRRLTLAKETLTELRSDELTNVGGGALREILSRDVCLADPSGKLAICESLLRACVSYTCTAP
jgi:hypothetical protein